ncbi:RNA-directed DNA polymerase, eukaryota, reverse transcriptase zinc-binding domain protein [Tanacetum coccineum]
MPLLVIKTALITLWDADMYTISSSFSLGATSRGSSDKCCLSCLKACSTSGIQWKSLFLMHFFKVLNSGRDFSADLERNLFRLANFLLRFWTSLIVRGDGSYCTTSVLSRHTTEQANILPIGGCYYTWMNKAGTKLSKIDHFLIRDDILEAIPDIHITALDHLWSDHTPILFHVKKSNIGPSLFKLYNSWLLRDGFDDLIRSTWSSMENQSNDKSLMSHEKLRSIKGSIKQWHNNIKINDHNKRLEALNDLKVIDKKIDDGSANENDRENHIKHLQDIDNLDNLEAHELIQKAHIKWDIDGDEDSKFFHGIIN